MTAARTLQIDDWVVHRPNVVRSVAARVPGIDAEEATSRALEKMVRIVSTGATIEQPAPYWRRAAVNEAISMTREAGRTHAVEDDTLADLTPPIAGAELDAERHADVRMLRTALADLADDDRQILLDRHVHDRAVTDIATGLGVRPHAVTMRLRRAEERLAGAFAAAHAHTVNEPECRTTRAAMHDYLKDRLLPRRRGRVEAHMDSCAECTRAFVDVREVSWMLRDLGQHVVAGAVATGALGAAVGAGGAGGGAAGAGSPSFGKKEAAVVAGVLAALAVGGGAAALAANQADEPPAAQSAPNPGVGGGTGGGGAGGGGGTGGGAGSGTADGSNGGAGGRADAEPGTQAGAGNDAGEGNGGASGGGSGAGGDRDDAGLGGSDGDGSDGDGSGSGTADGTDSGLGAQVTDWLATFGLGDGASEGEAGSETSPGTGSADGETSERSPQGGDGSTTADGTRTGIGAEVTSWLGRLGAVGIPGFLLIVVILWLWERWTRAEEN